MYIFFIMRKQYTMPVMINGRMLDIVRLHEYLRKSNRNKARTVHKTRELIQ